MVAEFDRMLYLNPMASRKQIKEIGGTVVLRLIAGMFAALALYVL